MFLRKTLDWGHHLVKVTYDYMLELAARKNAMLFLFIVAFVESSFFPIPPDIMLIPMVLAMPVKAYRRRPRPRTNPRAGRRPMRPMR